MALPLQANELPPDLRMNGAASHALHQGVDVGEYMTVADDPDRCASRGAGRLPLESAAQQKSQKHLCSRTVVMLRISKTLQDGQEAHYVVSSHSDIRFCVSSSMMRTAHGTAQLTPPPVTLTIALSVVIDQPVDSAGRRWGRIPRGN
jgi:hypothetical protein